MSTTFRPVQRAARTLSRTIAASQTFARGVGMLERLAHWPQGAIAVLTYHRVDFLDRDPSLYPGLISATPTAFSEQMETLAAFASVVSAGDVLAARRGDAPLPPRAVLLTFDDAYCDFAEHAWPTLERLGLPAVLFVPTAYPDRPERRFWWDRIHTALASWPADSVWTPYGVLPLRDSDERVLAFRLLRNRLKAVPHEELVTVVDMLAKQAGIPEPPGAVLGWDELRRLAVAGVTLAPHSRTHPLLDRLAEDELAEEIDGSRSDLERETGERSPLFAYPGGGFDARVLQLVRELGFEMAFTTRRGVNKGPCDWLRLSRINVGRGTTPSLIRAQLLPIAAPVLERVR